MGGSASSRVYLRFWFSVQSVRPSPHPQSWPGWGVSAVCNEIVCFLDFQTFVTVNYNAPYSDQLSHLDISHTLSSFHTHSYNPLSCSYFCGFVLKTRVVVFACICTCAKACELVLSFHLFVNFRHQTQVARLAWQTSLSAEPSH